MIFKIFSIVLLLNSVASNPQFLTFEDGKIGVNFGGYHAEAGLGGLLTGNAAHGGLSASAGTPYGQSAAAGLGGSLDGRTTGGLYAGATAGKGISASAGLGGGVDSGSSYGLISANSEAGGVSKQWTVEQPPAVDATYSKTFSIGGNVDKHISVGGGSVGSVSGGYDTIQTVEQPQQVTYVQKVKKLHRHHPHKVIYTEVQVPTQTQTFTHTKSYQPSIFDFKKFFNFGVYKHLGFGHGFGGRKTIQVQQVQPQQDTYVVEEKVVPQVIYEKRIVPKVVYEKRIVPEVVIEKKIVNQTVVVHKKVESPPPQTTTVVKSVAPAVTIKKEITINKNVQTDVNSGVAVDTNTFGTAGSSYGSDATISGSVSGGFSKSKSHIIDDIFNIPIATLQAVNKLVSNKAASHGGGISIEKNVEIHTS